MENLPGVSYYCSRPGGGSSSLFLILSGLRCARFLCGRFLSRPGERAHFLGPFFFCQSLELYIPEKYSEKRFLTVLFSIPGRYYCTVTVCTYSIHNNVCILLGIIMSTGDVLVLRHSPSFVRGSALRLARPHCIAANDASTVQDTSHPLMIPTMVGCMVAVLRSV